MFRREGADVHSDVTISVSQALLGGSLRIRGIHEALVLNVSPVVVLFLISWFYFFALRTGGKESAV